MKKKKVAKLLALAMAGMMTLSGCGGTGGTDSNTDSASQPETGSAANTDSETTSDEADSAEQTLIAGLRLALKPLGVIVKNSLKRQINDRIYATTMLMGGGRFFMISEDCGSLINAFKGAVWDDKVIGKDERLDDGTSDIDTLDAFEYSFEKFIPQLIRSEK